MYLETRKGGREAKVEIHFEILSHLRRELATEQLIKGQAFGFVRGQLFVSDNALHVQGQEKREMKGKMGIVQAAPLKMEQGQTGVRHGQHVGVAPSQMPCQIQVEVAFELLTCLRGVRLLAIPLQRFILLSLGGPKGSMLSAVCGQITLHTPTFPGMVSSVLSHQP